MNFVSNEIHLTSKLHVKVLKMLKELRYLLMILTITHLHCESCQGEGVFGVDSKHFPKSSCLTINQVETAGGCFLRCLNALDVHYLFSYSQAQERCMCCFDLSGTDVTNFQWKTYVPRPCKDGYVTYNNTDHEICVKLVSIEVPYPEAAALCQAEGGDLFKVDTKLKYDILTEYLAPVANGNSLDVWIQGEKVGAEWRFHDGSPMPIHSNDVCPVRLGGDPKEIRIRAGTSTGPTQFFCKDQVDTKPYPYVCEYSRSFKFVK